MQFFVFISGFRSWVFGLRSPVFCLVFSLQSLVASLGNQSKAKQKETE